MGLGPGRVTGGGRVGDEKGSEGWRQSPKANAASPLPNERSCRRLVEAQRGDHLGPARVAAHQLRDHVLEARGVAGGLRVLPAAPFCWWASRTQDRGGGMQGDVIWGVWRGRIVLDFKRTMSHKVVWGLAGAHRVAGYD